MKHAVIIPGQNRRAPPLLLLQFQIFLLQLFLLPFLILPFLFSLQLPTLLLPSVQLSPLKLPSPALCFSYCSSSSPSLFSVLCFRPLRFLAAPIPLPTASESYCHLSPPGFLHKRSLPACCPKPPKRH